MGIFRLDTRKLVLSLEDDIKELRSALQKLSGALATLEDKHLRLEAAHLSLRGYTYSLKAQHAGGIKPEAPSPSRDEMRRASGFVPGKPMEHKS